MAMKVQFAPWFRPFTYPCEFKSIAGGRASGKSHHVAHFAVMRMAGLFSNPDHIGLIMPDGMPYPYYPPGPIRILSGRQFSVSLKQSVKTVMEEAVFNIGLGDQFTIKNKEIEHRNGSVCFFEGIDRNIDKHRSAANIDIWWFEEAQFLTHDHMRTILPTARHYAICPITGKRFVNEKWMVYNPKYRGDWAWDWFVENHREQDLHIHVNYDENPWCPPNMRMLAEVDKARFPDYYEHVWLGQPDDSDASAQVLPYRHVEACINAWDKRPSLSPQMRTDMGLDIAIGGTDFCAAAVRTGPIVHGIHTWNGVRDLNIIARQAKDILEEESDRHGVRPLRIFFDGAHPMEGSFNLVRPPAAYESVLFGGAVMGKDSKWESKITNGDYFAKRNIQMGTALRLRAERTIRLLEEGGGAVDPNACLFINPDIKGIKRITSMLTQPTRRLNTAGRWEIEKDAGDPMAKSPDEFDALCLAFHADLTGGLRARE